MTPEEKEALALLAAKGFTDVEFTGEVYRAHGEDYRVYQSTTGETLFDAPGVRVSGGLVPWTVLLGFE